MKQLNGLKGLLPYLKARKTKIVFILLLSLVDAGLGLLPIQIVAALVDVLSTGKSMFYGLLGDRIEGYLLFFGAAYLAKQAVGIVYGHKNAVLAQSIIESLRDDAMAWAMDSFKPYREDKKEGDVVSRVSGDVEAVVRAVAGPLNGFLPMILKMLGSLVILALWSPVLGAVALVLVFPLYYASKRVSLRAKEIAAEQRAANGRLVGAVSELLYAIPVIKAWGSERFERRRFHERSHELFALDQGLQRAFDVYWSVTCLLQAFGYLAAVALATRAALAGAMTAGGIAVAYSYMSNVLAPAVSLSRYGNDLLQADASLSRVFALRPDAAETAPPLELSAAPTVELRNVSVACSETRSITDLSFTARPNQLVMLSGESGSGKSTLLNALLGNQPITEGKILVNGKDMAHQLDRLRRSVSVSFQEPYLFDRSLLHNVAYACDEPDRDRAEKALRAAGLGALVDERGIGYETGTKGKDLSGGEQRRVAFSRAIYKKERVYLFDEPTSELDAESARIIRNELLELKKAATVIVASHDPEMAACADQIIQL